MKQSKYKEKRKKHNEQLMKSTDAYTQMLERIIWFWNFVHEKFWFCFGSLKYFDIFDDFFFDWHCWLSNKTRYTFDNIIILLLFFIFGT